MDFGRVTLDESLILYLFGTPGQHRFWFMWDDLIRGAIGAVVLVDTRRLADSFAAVDYFESAGLPFIVAVNGFDGDFPHAVTDVQGRAVGRLARAGDPLRRPAALVHQGRTADPGRARHGDAARAQVTSDQRSSGRSAWGAGRVVLPGRAGCGLRS